MQAFAIWIFLATVSAAPSLAAAAVEAGCGVDRYEPNDQRARAKSTRGKRVEARVCGDDSDWYYVALEAGTTVVIDAEHPEGAAIDVDFFPPRSRKAQGAVTRTDKSVKVRFRVEQSGKHRFRVRAASGAASVYGLEVRTGG